MGKIINLDSGGKQRAILQRNILHACRCYCTEQNINSEVLDIVAFIYSTLKEIEKSIELTTSAWERRDYWVKADRFRMEWSWARRLGMAMQQAVLVDDWAGVAGSAAQIAMKVNGVKVPQRHNLGTPWVGARKRLAQVSAAAH